MKSVVTQGRYSFQNQSPKSLKKARVLAVIGLLTVFLSLFAGTQYFAMTYGKNRLQGGFKIVGINIYAPWQIIEWAGSYKKRAGNIDPFNESLIITGVVAFMGLAMFGMGIRQLRAGDKADMGSVHGSARWATREELEKAMVLPRKGKKGAGVYLGGWINPQDGKYHYLRHDGKEHIAVCIRTRGGKGIAIILPTLLSWEHSVVVLDIKGENWSLTSGYRQSQGQKVLRWDPTDAIRGRSAAYNPLAEVRVQSPHEIGDIMNVAGILVDPSGKGEGDHWVDTARSLLSGAIAHEIYKARQEDRSANLADVLIELTKPGQSYEDTMQEWLQFEHARAGDVFYNTQGEPSESKSHPLVLKAAQEMLSRAEAEASSVLSSAVKCLELFIDPVIARNTSKSDFKITDLMDGETPVSLYLVLSPASLSRIRPLVRLFLTQMINNLLPEMEFRGGEQIAPYKHRLLLLFDELPSIGKMKVINDAIAYFGGWNIKLMSIFQDLA